MTGLADCYTLKFEKLCDRSYWKRHENSWTRCATRGQRAGEALVRVHRVAICGSDWHAFEGAQANYTFPRIIVMSWAARCWRFRRTIAASGRETGAPSSLI